MISNKNHLKVQRTLTLSDLKRHLCAAKFYRNKITSEEIWAIDAWIVSGSEFSLLGFVIDPATDMILIRGDTEPDPESGIWIEEKVDFEESYTLIWSSSTFFVSSRNAHALT